MADKRKAVDDIIALIRTHTAYAVERYTNGDCYQFHLLLKRHFPEAEPWYDRVDGHVLSCLHGALWDITGMRWTVPKAPPHVVPWAQLEEWIQNDAMNWAWSPPNQG